MNPESLIAPSPTEYRPYSRESLWAPPSRCDRCNSQQKENTRNLIVCIDGTCNELGPRSTNVVKLFQKIDQGTTPGQHARYFSGIGTGAKPSHLLNRMGRAVSERVDMAVAWHVGETVKKAYGWLAEMYQEGDQIYLFGFSRGAYQVRLLAAMIHEVGLMKEPSEKLIASAYDLYAERKSNKLITTEFKKVYSWMDSRVHFVGVWDTVSSVGFVRGNSFLSASSSAPHACHFRHALALDELRVKFMPEYLHEIHSQANDESKYIVTSSDAEDATYPLHERRGATMCETDLPGAKNRTSDIKEVWFAGCHSDVGGTDRPGKSHHAGNVSLLWMRREAAASGLVLHPTDIVWVPDDIDLGMHESMTNAWRALEYLPITYQTSFSGAGDNARCFHRLHPRRIIPGQKIHASILYASAYKPRASLGEGFYIPLVHDELDEELDDGLWETGLFDGTAAQELVGHLGSQQGVPPTFLDRLLFMLRFEEGKRCVRNVPNWKALFLSPIHNRDCAPLVRLVAIVAYYEASCGHDVQPGSPSPPHLDLPQELFDDARKCLSAILATDKHQDGPTVVALLRPLTKHQVLRERILTQDVLEMLIKLFDEIINQTDGVFGQTMHGLECLLHRADTRNIVIENLGASAPYSNVTRLSQVLEVKDERLLAAALRMVRTLARIPEARAMCSITKPRLRDLARKEKSIVGVAAAEILISLYDANDRKRLSIRHPEARANLAGALIRLDADRHDSVNGQGCGIESGHQILRRLLGLDTTALDETQKRLIGDLKAVAQSVIARERTGSTFALLKLCETEIMRKHLREIDLLGIFIDQLRHKETSLLAAYALVTCLRFSDMMESVKDNELLPKNIVYMLQHNYFDDAVGRVEGFQIFGDFMQHADLREKLKHHDIADVLLMRLAKGKSKETRTSLICLEIFRSFDQAGHPGSRILEGLGGAHGNKSVYDGYTAKTSPLVSPC